MGLGAGWLGVNAEHTFYLLVLRIRNAAAGFVHKGGGWGQVWGEDAAGLSLL